jgi:hypothetical protein
LTEDIDLLSDLLPFGGAQLDDVALGVALPADQLVEDGDLNVRSGRPQRTDADQDVGAFCPFSVGALANSEL